MPVGPLTYPPLSVHCRALPRPGATHVRVYQPVFYWGCKEGVMGVSSQVATVWVGYVVGPTDSIQSRHPAEFLAFATEKAAREWLEEPEWLTYQRRNPYGASRSILELEVQHGAS